MNLCLRAQAAGGSPAGVGMKLDGYLAWAAKQNVLLTRKSR